METSTAYADTPSFMNWTDPTPTSLAPFDGNAEAIASLAGTSIFVYPHPHSNAAFPYTHGPASYSGVQYVTGALVVDATPSQVERVLSNYTDYTHLFPKITKAEILANEMRGNWSSEPNATIRSIVRYHMLISVPVPLLTFDEDLIMQHERTHHSISTIIVSAPIQYGSGKFEWFPLKNGKTLVTLTQWADLEHPTGFLVSTIFNALPEIKLALPYGIDGFVMQALRERFNHDILPKPAPESSVMPQVSLSPTQEAQVTKLLQPGGLVQFGHTPVQLARPEHPDTLWFVSSYYLMPESAARSRETLANPQHFPDIYRQVRHVDTTPLPNGATANDIKIGIGIGILSIPIWTKLNYVPDAATGNVQLYSTGGDIEWVQGRLQFKGLSPQSTLIGLTAAGHLGEHPPFPLSLGKSLPYLDYLSAAGAAPVVFDKAKVWMKKNAAK